MYTKRILVIGAGFLQKFVIQKARELGYYTLSLDGDENAVGFSLSDESATINIIDQEACLAFAIEHQIDGVLTAATDYGVLTASYIAEKLHLPGISYASALRIKNKFQVRKCLSEAGADDTGECFEITDISQVLDVMQKVRYPMMIKPCDGSGSRGAARVDNSEDFQKACRDALNLSPTHKVLAEPFVEGHEYGVESFVYNGKVFVLGIMRKHMTEPPYYAELGHCIPSGLSDAMEEKIRVCVTRAIQTLEIDFGSVNMDLLISEQGNIHIVDIGARMGGNLIGSHIIPLGTGVDYIANMIRAAVGDPVDFTLKVKSTPVATRLLALQPGTIASVPDIKGLEQKEHVIIEHHLSVGNEIRRYCNNLDGCGYVVAVDYDVLLAEERAENIRNIIDRSIIRKV